MSNQSERQLGAFQFLYLATFHKPFSGQTNKMTELRNGVVHKGKIPTREEALAYAEHVFRLIYDSRQELVALNENAVRCVEARAFSVHLDKLEKRALPDSDGEKHTMELHYGMMLRHWGSAEWSEPGDFIWNLEALAYSVKVSGAGVLAEDKPFTKFDPTAGDVEDYDREDEQHVEDN